MSKFEIVKKALEPKVKGKEITKNSTFKELGLDSLDLVEVVLEVEELLDYKFKDEDLISLKSIQDVLDKVGE